MCNYEPLKAWDSKNEEDKFKNKLTIRLAPFAAIYFVSKKRKSSKD